MARPNDGIEVTEDNQSMSEVGIVACSVVTETQWQCPGCKGRFAKRGVHSGQLKRCKRCGARFFLRR
jgi:hypothetical protein